MSQVSIIDIEGSHPTIPTEFIANIGSAIPIANQLEILGDTVAAGVLPVYTTGSGNTITTNVQLSQAIAASNALNVGLSAFNSADFTVDANGFVSLIGGSAAIDSVATNVGGPVLPNGAGQISILGSISVASGSPLHTSGLVANTVNVIAQVSTAQAVTGINNVGMSSFNSSHFSVDGNGFVSLAGGGVAIDSVGTQTGTNPIVPTAAGLITINGAVVAAGTNPMRSHGTGANTMALEVQISQALAATDATKIGLSNFNSAHFSVDANGFVAATGAIAIQFTGNSGTATPSAGNINILAASTAAGTSPASTTASGSTVTVNVQKSQAIAATDATKVGLCNFNSTQFSVDANGFVALAGGGLAIDSIGTQTGTNPIAPTAAGLVTINGAVVAAGTNPVRSDGTGANTMAIEVQISQAIAATDATKIGLSNFNSSHFSVDANGFVALAGGGQAIDSVTVDAATAPGTNPVVPTGAGLITVTGAQVAAGIVGTNVIRTDSLAANTYTVEIQRSTTTATPTVASNGVSHYNSINFNVDSNAYVTAKTGLEPGVSNIGITYSSNTFSITAADGSALSSTNIGYVTLQSKTAGRLKTVAVTANQTFVDSTGSSTIIGNLFGLTTGIAATNAIPFFIYAVLDDTEAVITFMVSRYPNTRISPVAANIGKSGSAIGDTQGSFFAMANVTVADYESNPCLAVGSFRMTMNSSNDWAVTALDFRDGIGCFQEDRSFTWGTNLWGAAASSYFYANGGTAPQFSDVGFGYYIDRMNQIQISSKLANCTTAGVGAVNLQLAIPFSVDGDVIGSGKVVDASLNVYVACTSVQAAGPNNKMLLTIVNAASNLVLLNNSVTLSANYVISYFLRSMIVFS